MRYPHPILPADLAFASVEEMRHYCAIGKSLLVLLQRFNFDEASSAVPDGVIISIAMRPLNDDLVFQTTHVRGNVKYRRIVPAGHARCGSNH